MSLLSRLWKKSRRSHKSSSRRNSHHCTIATKHLAVESLERRELLTILYWDTNGQQAGVGGSGAWSAAAALWSTDPLGGGTLQTLGPNDDAVFSGNAGTVTISGTVSAHSIRFSTTAYALQSGNISLSSTGTEIIVDSGLNAAINTMITGSGGLTKSGSGTLTLDT